jgi:tRNA 2-thiouridine synthesizing protein E
MSDSHFIECHGKRIAVTPYGFLVKSDDWAEELALQLAPQENIDTLTEEHWQVLHFLREYYSRFNIAPMGKKIAYPWARC